MLSIVYWKIGTWRSRKFRFPCFRAGSPGSEEGKETAHVPYSAEADCRHRVVCVLTRGPVCSGCSLSFPSACGLCSRDKSPAAPYVPQSSLPRARAEETQMSYNSLFRNLNLIMYHFFWNFPRTEFSCIYPGHKSTVLCIHFWITKMGKWLVK